MSMTAFIRSTIDELLKTVGVTTPIEVERYIRTHHSEEFWAHSDRLAGQQVRSKAQQMLTGDGLVKDPTLPGFDVQRVFTVPTEGGQCVYVAAWKATLADVDADLGVKAKNVKAVQSEYDQAVIRRERLWAVPNANPAMTVFEAIAGMS